jgi:hypothetical protein
MKKPKIKGLPRLKAVGGMKPPMPEKGDSSKEKMPKEKKFAKSLGIKSFKY